MIAIDTSALVAIILDEKEGPSYHAALMRAPKALISAVSVVEAKIVLLGRRGPAGVALLDALLMTRTVEIVPPTPQDTELAYRAFVVYGKGRGHPAALNFGDLFAYALAKSFKVPLLFKGQDFAQTDIEAVPVG